MSDNGQREEPRMISYYEHEKALMHYGAVNKRSMVALITVCIAFVLITAIFVVAYTVREKNWLDTIAAMRAPAVSTEAEYGVHEQPDP